MKKILVDERPMEFKLESGSKVHIIQKSMFKSLNKQFNVRTTNIRLAVYGCFKLHPILRFDTCVKLN